MKRIFQLKIELRDSNPKVWRRILVPDETTFSDLHDIIQLSMGWEHDHLYEFILKKIRIYDFQDVIDDGTNPLERDSMDTFLDEMVKKVKTKFTYVYDFGDHWEHVIQLEKILPEDESTTYPVCLNGERACPPEDCGGPWSYQNMLGILADKSHPEYDHITGWIGEDWDPEVFDRERVNALLQDYTEQWGEIYEETDQIIRSLEGEDGGLEDFHRDSYDADEDNEQDELKKFSSPEDVLRDEYERLEMEIWVGTALQEDNTIEKDTYKRLCDSGLDEKSSKNLILQALSIEWFYDLKYGTGHLEDRYEYNLHHLPETPLELPRLKDALRVLDRCMKGIPFQAIEYVQNDPSDEATSAVLTALRNHSDHQYCWADCARAPFWYALAAEGHLCEELIDPVIQLYEDNADDSDWLCEQGQYLIGKLAEKYPDITTQRVLEAMEKDVNKSTKPYIFFLFDAFYFCDVEKYKPRLLALLEHDEVSWFDALAATFADLHIKEGLPVLRRKVEKLRANSDKDIRYKHAVIEVEEAINILEGELRVDPDTVKPLSLKRETSWKEDLKQNEALFYQSEGYSNDFSFPNHFDQDSKESSQWPLFSSTKPLIKEKTPGRNDPCHCGSGRKYKKCCMDKDG